MSNWKIENKSTDVTDFKYHSECSNGKTDAPIKRYCPYHSILLPEFLVVSGSSHFRNVSRTF